MKHMILSYPISGSTPLYPGTPKFKVSKVKEMAKGDSCNSLVFSISNHSGTHIDCPAHFCQEGKKVGDYKSANLIFKNAVVVYIPKEPDEPIRAGEFNNVPNDNTAEFVMIRTGFSKYRNTRAAIYSGSNPYLLPEAVERLKKKFKKMRALGVDTISVSSALHREAGRAAHKNLLGARHQVLIVEDMKIPAAPQRFKEVIVYPFITGKIDSSPCAVIGIRYD